MADIASSLLAKLKKRPKRPELVISNVCSCFFRKSPCANSQDRRIQKTLF